MHDTASPSRTADLIALAQATDANGHVDLTAYQAQRLILLHQSLDGLDAGGLVGELMNSPAYASTEGREQIGPLLDAISSRLPSGDAERFSTALDQAHINESWLERNYERYVEEPVSAGYLQAKQAVGDGVAWTDRQISDNLAAAKRWAEGARDNPQNGYLERAAGGLAEDGIGKVQENYGAMKGATSHGLAMLGETVDLAKLAHRFSTDRDFRNLIIGAAAIYASDAYHDPSKPVTDISNAAVRAWNEWEAGFEQATREGKQQEYLGEAKGAAAVEIIATFVPVSKLTKLAKVARAVDVADDLAPDGAGRAAGRIEGRVAGELTEELVELARDAARVQARGGLEGKGADLAFSGLAGLKRSQGELRELVEGLRKSGDLDGLLQSGALAPRELNYLARQDVTMFDGSVSFNQALTKSLGGRELSALKSGEVGDIGEAIVAHDLARKGYRDLVPIQNNSGHGNDLAGINPETGRWEVVEVKASVKGIAKTQAGDPEVVITSRLNRAARGLDHWAAKNMWEEQAKPTAERIIDETLNKGTGKVDVDPKWARVNLDRDPVTGELKATPEIEPWLSPAQRKQGLESPPGIGEPTPSASTHASLAEPGDRSALRAVPASFAPPLQLASDFHDPAHPAHTSFRRTLDEVHRMEDTQRIAHGPHSEQLAAALFIAAGRNGQDITQVEMGQNGVVRGIERHSYFDPEKRVEVSTQEALSVSMEQYASQWARSRSPHYASATPAGARSQEQAQALALYPPNDRDLFEKIRGATPASVSDGHVVQSMHLAKQQGMTDADKVRGVAMAGDKMWIAGTTPGQRVALDVSQPAPPLHDTVQDTLALNQQLAMNQQQEAAQREQRAQQGPVV